MAILKELDLPQYKQSLRKAVSFLNNLDYSPVKTKYNAKGNWDAISIRGYSDDIGNILKPGVLKSDVKAEPLRWTRLYEEPELLPIKEINKSQNSSLFCLPIFLSEMLKVLLNLFTEHFLL